MAGIVFGCTVPHPPLMVPDVGRGQERAISATIDAMELVNQKLASQEPEIVLIISPHGKTHENAMGILTAASCTGDMHGWGTREPTSRFNNDLELVKLIQQEAEAANVPLKSIGERGYELDHGVMAPLYYLMSSVEKHPLVPLTFSWLPYEMHFAFGKAIQRAADKRKKRVALIASGDLSHRLIPSAPAGYDPQGKIFDEKLVQALSHLDTKSIMSFDRELIERAGECGLRSIIILLGALDGLKVKTDVLSYEGPFGVGYLVASFEIKTGKYA